MLRAKIASMQLPRSFKIGLATAVPLIILLALFRQSIGVSYLLWYHSTYLCDELQFQCDTTIAPLPEMPIEAPNASGTSTTVTFGGVSLPIPFMVASSSVNAMSASYEGEQAAEGRQRLLIFADGYTINPEYLAPTRGEEAAFTALAREYISSVATGDPSHYEFLRRTIEFAPSDIRHFTSLDAKVQQYVHLREKRWLHGPRVFTVERSDLSGYVLAAPNPNTGRTVYEFNFFSPKNSAKTRVAVWGISEAEMVALVDALRFVGE